MKYSTRKLFRTGMILLLLPFAGHAAFQPIAGKPVTISLFADSVVTLDKNAGGSAAVNQLELGLEAALYKQLKGSAALAYNAETGAMELGAAVLAWSPVTAPAVLTVTIGQMDIPFGLTSGWYGAPDNALIRTPLVNETGINGWNNTAGLLSLDLGFAEFQFFLSDGSMEQITDSGKGAAYGGRAAFKIGEKLQAAVSMAGNRHAADGTVYKFAAADLSFSPGPFTLSLEAVNSSTDAILRNSSTGWMAQLRLHGKYMIRLPLDLTLRTGGFSPASGPDRFRFSAGLTALVGDSLRAALVFEHSNDEADTFSLQILTSF